MHKSVFNCHCVAVGYAESAVSYLLAGLFSGMCTKSVNGFRVGQFLQAKNSPMSLDESHDNFAGLILSG